jgi:hypothetical protein
MATLHVSRALVRDRAATGATLPLPAAQPRAAKTMTTGATSIQADLVAEAGEVWVVTAVGAPHVVRFGPAPVTAGPDAGWLIPDGCTREFAAEAGQQIAARTA